MRWTATFSFREVAGRGLLMNLTSINEIINPVDAPARKYSDAVGL